MAGNRNVPDLLNDDELALYSPPLPTGASTAAKQDTGNTSLSSIDGKITAVNTGAVVLTAGSALIGKVSAGADSSTVYDGVTAKTPARAFANVAASQTDSNIVSSPGAVKIRVLAAYAVAGATATNLTFNTKPAGAGSAISPLFANGANGGEVLPFNPAGWFETNTSEGLTVTTGAGSTTGIGVIYITI
jgi:hypothetical protein